jgi:hypothetical protein
MKNIYKKIATAFDSLPSPIKAIFYVTLNGLLVLLARDIEALKGENEYLAVILGGLGNIVTYLALYFGAKKED